MKILLKTAMFLTIVIMMNLSCRSDSQENPRAFVEGKVVSSAVDYNLFLLRIISDEKIVAETKLEQGGNFKLSGPVFETGFTIISTEKIKSFSADKTGLALSSDALQISVPKGITYIKFNEIVLEK